MPAAQVLFKTEERKRQLKRERLIKRGMSLWDSSAEQFNELPERYRELLQEKRERRMATGTLKAEVLNSYPRIRLFEIEDRDEAEARLTNMQLARLEDEISSIELILESDYCYRTLSTWVKEAEYLIRHPKRVPTLMF